MYGCGSRQLHKMRCDRVLCETPLLGTLISSDLSCNTHENKSLLTRNINAKEITKNL